MRILICGSTEYEDYNFLETTCTNIISKIQYDNIIPNNKLEIISGNANRGADRLGEKFARKYNVSLKLFPAEWNNMDVPVVSEGTNYYGKYNKLAGVQRNTKMVDYVSEDNGIVIAFRVDESKGTSDTIKKAKKAGLKVYQIDYDKEKKIKIWN